MRIVQRACVLWPRHHGVMSLPPPRRLLGCPRQYGVSAAPQAFRPPPPLQGVQVHSGLRPDNSSQYQIRAALLARGRLPHLHLHAVTEANQSPPALHPLPSAIINQPGHQEPSIFRNHHHPFPLNRVAHLAALVFPPHHLVFSALWTGASQPLRTRPGETQSPPLSGRLPINIRILPLGIALLHPAPPSAPIWPMGNQVGIMLKWDRNRDRDKTIGQQGAAVVIEEVGGVPRGGRRQRHRLPRALARMLHTQVCST